MQERLVVRDGLDEIVSLKLRARYRHRVRKGPHGRRNDAKQSGLKYVGGLHT
jgi:hypothetical protein